MLQEHITGLAVAETLSLPDGTFSVSGVPRGLYRLYAEPLDGPFQPSAVFSGIWATNGPMNTSFRSAYKGGTASPRVFVVRANTATNVGLFYLFGPAPSVNLETLGLCQPGPLGALACTGITSGPLQVTPPFTDSLFIGGAGLHNLPDSGFSIDGPFASITGPNIFGTSLTNAKVFPVSISADAPPGGYVIRYEDPVTGELALLSGSLDVEAPAIPLAYVAPYASPCQGSAGPVNLASTTPPTLGTQAFNLTLGGTVAGETAFFLFAFNPDHQNLPPPGCVLAVDLFSLLVPFPGTTIPITGSSVSLTFAIPNIPFLDGRDVFAQAFTTDAAALGGFGLSNGLVIHME